MDKFFTDRDASIILNTDELLQVLSTSNSDQFQVMSKDNVKGYYTEATVKKIIDYIEQRKVNESKIVELQKEVSELKRRVDEMLAYAPEGDGYVETKGHFEKAKEN